MFKEETRLVAFLNEKVEVEFRLAVVLFEDHKPVYVHDSYRINVNDILDDLINEGMNIEGIAITKSYLDDIQEAFNKPVIFGMEGAIKEVTSLSELNEPLKRSTQYYVELYKNQLAASKPSEAIAVKLANECVPF